MASLILTHLPSSHRSLSYPSSSSSSSFTCSSSRDFHCFGQKFQSLKRVQFSKKNRRNIIVSQKVSVDLDPVTSLLDSSNSVSSLKLKLLSVVSGLNRGLAASEDDLRKADEAAKELEASAGPVDLSVDDELDKLQGRWKLIYSSAFSSRTLGGSRPGPPTGRLLPITLGQVFQRIDVVSKDFDNIVDLELGAPWPFPPLELTATLAHKFELEGTSKIKIIFEKTTVKTSGNLAQLPPLEIPRIPDALRSSSNTGSGDFEVTYIDSDTRVTRGDRGELRVFVIA